MTSTTLTRRGRIVATVCVLGVFMALVGGAPGLNAVVLSGAIALVAGYLQVSRVSAPRVRRSQPADGFVGEQRDVSLSVGVGDRQKSISSTFIARVTDETDDGLIGTAEGIRMTAGGEPATYTVEYDARGARRFGPIRIEPTDVFGLFRRTIVVDDRATALAYPKHHPIPARFRSRLSADAAVGPARRREEFDRIREYDRGDPLRDIHWPTTAKHDELVVREFTDESPDRRVSIVGRTVESADTGAADVLASATVSLGLALLEDGIAVDVRLPDGEAVASPGSTGRGDLLELTARTGPGTPAGEFEGGVRIVADATDARIHVGGRTAQFSKLRAEAAGAGASDETVDTTVTGASGTSHDDGTTEPTERRNAATTKRGGVPK